MLETLTWESSPCELVVKSCCWEDCLEGLWRVTSVGLGDKPAGNLPLGTTWRKRGAPLVVQTVRNLPAMQETWVQSLGLEDPVEKGILENPMEGAWWTIVHGVAKSQIQLSD